MRILFVYKHDRPFVKEDLRMLSKHFDVTPFFFKMSKIRKLRKELKKCDVVFIWFASYHAYITAKMTKKPIVVVTGGYDVAGEKDISYGLMLNPVYKRMVRYVLNKASKILAVSEFNKYEIFKHLGLNRAKVVYNSADYKKFKPEGEKEDIILTVGYLKKETWTRKGIIDFVETAQLFNLEALPGRFVVVGKINDDIKETVDYFRKTTNLTFTGFVSDEELLEWYQKSKVYCQFSRYESYGLAPAEAMLCECVPVVHKNGALPEVVGDTGFYATRYVDGIRDLGFMRDAVLKALNSDKGHLARERIKQMYNPEKREKELVKTMEELLI